MSEYVTFDMLRDELRKKPDLVQVVRCRDCKHGYKADLSGNWYECMKPDGNGDYARWEVEHDGFCAWGERTEDE